MRKSSTGGKSPMRRFTEKQYQRRVMVAMALYVGFMLLAWPEVRTTGSLPLKLLLALAPVAMMLYVIALMARRILHSDELEQRTHLVALGVATALVGAASLIGGFLAAAKLVQVNGIVLIWVFPLQLAAYGLTRWLVNRRYGNEMSCAEGGFTFRQRLALILLLMMAVALAVYWRHDDFDIGMLVGMGSSLALVLAWQGYRYWRKRRASPGGADEEQAR
ncbi:hypothetical protein [Rhodanobacter sp. 7MK24]|uniref:hypothetical protein n=1 Tax=Rhodanobacter sp. 7MK24 TaxID=2775922 RepID=UPI001CE09ABA|nr:hypothetical protein [Rhodanobacter sp. 7MK24]